VKAQVKKQRNYFQSEHAKKLFVINNPLFKPKRHLKVRQAKLFTSPRCSESVQPNLELPVKELPKMGKFSKLSRFTSLSRYEDLPYKRKLSEFRDSDFTKANPKGITFGEPRPPIEPEI